MPKAKRNKPVSLTKVKKQPGIPSIPSEGEAVAAADIDINDFEGWWGYPAEFLTNSLVNWPGSDLEFDLNDSMSGMNYLFPKSIQLYLINKK